MQGVLSERDQAVLVLERDWPRHDGGKEELIRTRLGMSPARFYQLLDRLIQTQEALEFDPLLIRRLRRRQEALAKARSRRMRGFFAG